jgi:hypothetical protein
MKTPVIKRNFWNLAASEKPSPFDVANRALELQYAAEQSQEQYITAEQARELGAGGAEYQYSKNNAPWTNWITCIDDCVYAESDYSWKVKYRATKQAQPEPADPHATLRAEYAKQVSWTGSREDVIALLKELEILK